MNGHIAVCIVNHNLPERTDALVARLREVLAVPHRFYVLDNGSDKASPAACTTHRIAPNRRTTSGWNEALLQAASDGGYAAYWLLCNDVTFHEDACPLTPMVKALFSEGFGLVHPAYTPASRSAWREMFRRPECGGATVENWAVEFNAPLIRADVLRHVWPFDAALVYGYGVDNEVGFLARRAGFRVGVCHGAVLEHEPFTTYREGADALSRDEYVREATANMQAVFARKYGPSWRSILREGRA